MQADDILFERNPNPMWIYAIDTLRFLAINEAAVEKYGYTKEQFLQMTLRDVRPEDAVKAMEQKVAEVAEHSLSSKSLWTHRNSAGDLFHVRVSSGAIEYAGVPARLVVVTDIEDLFRQQERIEQLNHELSLYIGFSEERFSKVFQHSAIGMCIVSDEGRFLKVNEALSNMLGYSETELMNRSFQELTYAEDLKKDLDLFEQMKAGGLETYQIEKRFLHKNGSLVWTVLTVSVSRNAPAPPSFVSQLVDITAIKKKEDELSDSLKIISEQNNRLFNFANIVSHNLRAYSNHFQLLLEMLGKQEDQAKREVLLARIRRISGQLSETVGHLADVVSIHNTEQKAIHPLSLRSYINKTIEVLEAQIEESSAIIDVDVDDDVMINYNPAYLESVLLNLISNAIKYRRPETLSHIDVSFYRDDENQAVLQVKDNGMGIDLSQYEARLFNMYETFHGNSDARGIGLFITKNQVEAMGGQIKVESEVNSGTVFKILLHEEETEHKF
ncbi:MAG: PAS domain S-box protein [Filimonas sp.]|nr:PAS domain S-box protein [Filimonas sp.]